MPAQRTQGVARNALLWDAAAGLKISGSAYEALQYANLSRKVIVWTLWADCGFTDMFVTKCCRCVRIHRTGGVPGDGISHIGLQFGEDFPSPQPPCTAIQTALVAVHVPFLLVPCAEKCSSV